MFTHMIKNGLFAAALGVFALIAANGSVSAAEFGPAQTSNILDSNLDGTDLLDTVNEQYPVNTSATVDDPRLLQPQLQSVEIVDNVDTYYPIDTSATIDDPRLLQPNVRNNVIVDRVDRYYPVDTSGNLEQTAGPGESL